jgi:hypothetical protein
MKVKYRRILMFYKTNQMGRTTEAQAIFLNTFIVCSMCKQKFVIGLCVDEETNGSCPFANGLNGLTHLWLYMI